MTKYKKCKCKFNGCKNNNKLYLNKCKYCNLNFCFSHICLESHNCAKLFLKKELEMENNKKNLDNKEFKKNKIEKI